MTHKTKITLFAGTVAVALGFLPAAAAFARDGADDDVSVQAGATVNVEIGDDKGGLRGVSASSSLGIRGDSDEDDNATSSRNRGGSATSSLVRQDGENRSDKSLKDDDEIEVRRDGARSASTTVDRPEKVSNRGQLRSFLNHIVKGDDRIVDVNVSSTTIETQYVMPARFLWAIPLDLTTEVKVASDGTVTVTYPWYAFLFSKKKGDDLKFELMTAASTTVSTTTPTSLSASLQARLLNSLFNTLKGSSK